MLGRLNQLQPKLFYNSFSLEQRIHKDHPLRKIKDIIDFSFIRSEVKYLYGYNGNQSIDPAVRCFAFCDPRGNGAGLSGIIGPSPILIGVELSGHPLRTNTRRHFSLKAFSNER